MTFYDPDENNSVMNVLRFGLLVLMATMTPLSGCCSGRSTDDISVVGNFQSERFTGVWHEVARLPQHFERGLTNVTATYSLEAGKLHITNRGFRKDKEVIATAVGRFAGPTDKGAFRISFFRPFYGDYRIIWLSPEYDTAVVTSSDRDSLWILSRTRKLPAETLARIIRQAEAWGFDVGRLEYPE